MPVFTQGAPDYDVLVAADESEVFAGYLPYRTWDPRPVAGSAGLVPTRWDRRSINGARCNCRAVSSGVSSLDDPARHAGLDRGAHGRRGRRARPIPPTPPNSLAFIKGPDFSVAAFKGQELTLRDWNLQLRQPILLFDGRNTVSVSPQEGYLHQFSELDTLGYDRPETKCKLQ